MPVQKGSIPQKLLKSMANVMYLQPEFKQTVGTFWPFETTQIDYKFTMGE